jgi:hypothetical protein
MEAPKEFCKEFDETEKMNARIYLYSGSVENLCKENYVYVTGIKEIKEAD